MYLLLTFKVREMQSPQHDGERKDKCNTETGTIRDSRSQASCEMLSCIQLQMRFQITLMSTVINH